MGKRPNITARQLTQLLHGLKPKHRRTKKQPTLPRPRSQPRADFNAEGVTLYLPLLTRSGNTFIRLHGIQRHREANTLGWHFVEVDSKLPSWVKKAAAGKRATVTYTRISDKKVLDTDNLTMGLKPLQDWLVKRGWIVDDSPAWLTNTVPIQLRPNGAVRTGTYIRIDYEGGLRAEGDSSRGGEAGAGDSGAEGEAGGGEPGGGGPGAGEGGEEDPDVPADGDEGED